MMQIWRQCMVVFRKELRDGARDTRSVVSALVFPLMGPAMVALIAFMVSRMDDRQREDVLHVEGAEHAPVLIERLERKLTVEPAPVDAEQQVRDGALQAVLRVPAEYEEQLQEGDPVVLELVVDSSKASNRGVVRSVERVVATQSSELGMMRLLARGVDPSLVQPFVLDTVDVSTPEHRGGSMIGAMLGMFVILSAFFCNLYIAIDATAGERERRSWEPLLLTPASRLSIVLGKWLAGLSFGMAGVTLCLFLTLLSLPLLDLDRIGVRLLLGPTTASMMLLHILPLAAMASAMQLLIASFCKSFKEAQTYLSLTLFVPMLPGMWMSFDPAPPAAWMMAVPALSQQILLSELLRGEAVALSWQLSAAGSALLATGLALWAMQRVVSREG